MLAIAATLPGCVGKTDLDPRRAGAVTVANQLPAPGLQDLLAGQSEYRLGPSDKIEVSVFGVPDLARATQIDSAGGFSMPLIGTIPAAGLTTNELGKQIAAALEKRYIRDPQVSVDLVEAASQQVTVDGSVKNPGKYPIPGGTTLMQAIAISGGATEFAKLNDVVVFRTVADKKMAAVFSLRDIRGGRAADPDIYGNDIVVVGDNYGKRLLRDLIQVTPLVGVFYQVYRR